MGCLHQHSSHLAVIYRLDRNGMLPKFLRIVITVVHFKDRNWISKTVNCNSCSVVCKIVFCSEFPDIPDNIDKVTRKRRRRRTQAIAKRYVFHANAKNIWHKFCTPLLLHFNFLFKCLQRDSSSQPLSW